MSHSCAPCARPQRAYQLELADYARKLTPWQLITADELSDPHDSARPSARSRRHRDAMRCFTCYQRTVWSVSLIFCLILVSLSTLWMVAWIIARRNARQENATSAEGFVGNATITEGFVATRCSDDPTYQLDGFTCATWDRAMRFNNASCEFVAASYYAYNASEVEDLLQACPATCDVPCDEERGAQAVAFPQLASAG